LDCFTSVQDVNKKYNLDFELRVGIHSGPVVAGVLGLKRFAYDVWGDTVNVS
jgi:adenylate cyclase